MSEAKIIGLFPNGRKKALTFSYDDGITQDKRLVKLFNDNGLKATFNLNSGIQSEESQWVNKGITIKRMNKADILHLYDGHEVAVHSMTHPHLENMTKSEVIEEILDDKKNLEAMFGYPVRGMAYPFGTYNETVLQVLREVGIEYSRTVNQHESFSLPEEPLTWNPTCYHKNPKLMDIVNKFLTEEPESMSLFYLWGHSYEFDLDDNWDLIEKFCSLVSGRNDIWYATNIEILDYINAFKSLKVSAESDMVYNPSAISVWVSVNNIQYEIKPGELKKF